MSKFQFGNVVVVGDAQIGVIVKTWSNKTGFSYDVYVRSNNNIKEFMEEEIRHFIYSKELSEGELEFYL